MAGDAANPKLLVGDDAMAAKLAVLEEKQQAKKDILFEDSPMNSHLSFQGMARPQTLVGRLASTR